MSERIEKVYADQVVPVPHGLDLRVLNSTGLDAWYLVRLEYSRTGEPAGTGRERGNEPALAASTPGGNDALFRAMEKQLGLKVEARNATTTKLVVDHFDRTPRGNLVQGQLLNAPVLQFADIE